MHEKTAVLVEVVEGSVARRFWESEIARAGPPPLRSNTFVPPPLPNMAIVGTADPACVDARYPVIENPLVEFRYRPKMLPMLTGMSLHRPCTLQKCTL